MKKVGGGGGGGAAEVYMEDRLRSSPARGHGKVFH